MHLLIISDHPKARSWAESLRFAGIAIVLHNKLRTAVAVEDIPKFDAMVVDQTQLRMLDDRVVKKFSMWCKTFVRIDLEHYDMPLLEQLLQRGVTGHFLEWPTLKLLEHEIVKRRTADRVIDARFGYLEIDGHLLRSGTHPPLKMGLREQQILKVLFDHHPRSAKATAFIEAFGIHPDCQSHTFGTCLGRLRSRLADYFDIGRFDLIGTRTNEGYELLLDRDFQSAIAGRIAAQ